MADCPKPDRVAHRAQIRSKVHLQEYRLTNSDSRPSRSTNTTKVVVATTVMLSFISFWRAAAIVLSDLASSAYYVGGIAETAIGKSAPWFILGIMLFSY